MAEKRPNFQKSEKATVKKFISVFYEFEYKTPEAAIQMVWPNHLPL